MKLSVVVVAYEMRRELPRALRSMTLGYQVLPSDCEYEVIVVDNGSKAPISSQEVAAFGPQFRTVFLDDPPLSPAYAINQGVADSTGEILCIVVDGAHILTPGVFRKALDCFRIQANAVVATRYFYLGPGPQNETIFNGYDKKEEDRLLEKIKWPKNGYRLFEIGMPLTFPEFPIYTWFYQPFESNCLFLSAMHFKSIGGADERFDYPGGGFMNIDLYLRSCATPEAVPYMLIGEGSFHQLHGGITTNVSKEVQREKAEIYREQYEVLRGKFEPMRKQLTYYGDIPIRSANIQRHNQHSGMS